MWNVDPDQPWQNVASDHNLHGLPFIQKFLETATVSKIELGQIYHKYGKKFRWWFFMH